MYIFNQCTNLFFCHGIAIPHPQDPRVVHWSDLVSNKELHWRTGQTNILTPSFSAVFAGSVTSCYSPMTTLPELSTSSTRHLQINDDLVPDYGGCRPPAPPIDLSGAGRCSDALPRPWTQRLHGIIFSSICEGRQSSLDLGDRKILNSNWCQEAQDRHFV